MFTGIVQCFGVVRNHENYNGELRLTVDARALAPEPIKVGDSVSVNGVCLTVVENREYWLRFDVSTETLKVTNLDQLSVGSRVNLELALSPGDRMGGHFVSGHVDGIAQLVAKQAIGSSEKMELAAPTHLLRYIANKGSVCLDGVSLTVNRVTENGFEVNIVPHTLRATTLGQYQLGQRVHLEVDVLARYLERLLEQKSATGIDEQGSVTPELLAEHGFLPPDLEADDSERQE